MIIDSPTNGATEQVRNKVALNKRFMITVNCSCIINLMYEVIKLAMCGSHGFSSDVRMRNFVHGDGITLSGPFLSLHIFHIRGICSLLEQSCDSSAIKKNNLASFS